MFWFQHLGCWGQNTSRIQNKKVYAALCLQAFTNVSHILPAQVKVDIDLWGKTVCGDHAVAPPCCGTPLPLGREPCDLLLSSLKQTMICAAKRIRCEFGHTRRCTPRRCRGLSVDNSFMYLHVLRQVYHACITAGEAARLKDMPVTLINYSQTSTPKGTRSRLFL